MIKVSDELLNDNVFNLEAYISKEFGRSPRNPCPPAGRSPHRRNSSGAWRSRTSSCNCQSPCPFFPPHRDGYWVVASKGEASWIDEEGAYPESDDSFGQVSIGAFKVATMIKVFTVVSFSSHTAFLR